MLKRSVSFQRLQNHTSSFIKLFVYNKEGQTPQFPTNFRHLDAMQQSIISRYLGRSFEMSAGTVISQPGKVRDSIP